MAREPFQTLSEPMYYVLLSLAKARCGAEIMQEVQRLSGERVTVGPGTLYTMLAKFLESGIIEETEVSGRKKTYLISEHGKELLREEYRRLAGMLEDGRAIMEDLNGEEKQDMPLQQLWAKRAGADAGVSGEDGAGGLVPPKDHRGVPVF